MPVRNDPPNLPHTSPLPRNHAGDGANDAQSKVSPRKASLTDPGARQSKRTKGSKSVRYAVRSEVAEIADLETTSVQRKADTFTKGAHNSTFCHVEVVGRDKGSTIYRVSWPSGQQYEGPMDAMDSPHGEGTLRLAAAGGQAPARPAAEASPALACTWSHGRCVTLAGHVDVPTFVEAFRAPPAVRHSSRPAAPPSPARRRAASRPQQKEDAGAATHSSATAPGMRTTTKLMGWLKGSTRK